MQRPVALALELHRHGASFVVVGSAAAALRGEPARPADLDVVVHPDDAGDFVSATISTGRKRASSEGAQTNAGSGA